MVSGEAGRRWSDRRILSGLARLVGSRADLARRIRLAITMLLVAAAATLTALAPVVFKWIVVDAFDSGISPAVAVPVALIGAYVGVQWLGRLAGELRWMVYGRLEQRVAIARAVLKQPRIFVFDEATSALDSATERLIQRNLETLLRGRRP